MSKSAEGESPPPSYYERVRRRWEKAFGVSMPLEDIERMKPLLDRAWHEGKDGSRN